MGWLVLVLVLLHLAVLLLWRAHVVLRKRGMPLAAGPRRTIALVVLGSGGHTTEMVKLMGGLGMAEADVLHFVLAHSDEASGSHAWAWIEKHGVPAGRVHFHRVHRAREVGQSWLSTYWTSLRALLHCLLITARARPNFLLLNGTCVPVLCAAMMWQLLGLFSFRSVFVESFCRTQTLSLAGRLLYPVVDTFVVQWPGLVRSWPRARFMGVLV